MIFFLILVCFLELAVFLLACFMPDAFKRLWLLFHNQASARRLTGLLILPMSVLALCDSSHSQDTYLVTGQVLAAITLAKSVALIVAPEFLTKKLTSLYLELSVRQYRLVGYLALSVSLLCIWLFYQITFS